MVQSSLTHPKIISKGDTYYKVIFMFTSKTHLREFVQRKNHICTEVARFTFKDCTL